MRRRLNQTLHRVKASSVVKETYLCDAYRFKYIVRLARNLSFYNPNFHHQDPSLLKRAFRTEIRPRVTKETLLSPYRHIFTRHALMGLGIP